MKKIALAWVFVLLLCGSAWAGQKVTGDLEVTGDAFFKGGPWVSVDHPDFGTVDKTGVASSQTAVAAAVAYAYSAGNSLYWPVGTYLTTASIPNFHDVRHYGPGIVKRGSTTFPITHTASTANALYVATTGADTNDGLTSSQPFLTIQACVNAMAKWGPLHGTWTVWVAAGTYEESVQLPDYLNGSMDIADYIIIRGPSVATVQTEPTVFIDYPGGSEVVGMDVGAYNKVKVQDIKFTDWKTHSGDTGLRTGTHSILYAYNVHTDLCFWGIVADTLSQLYVQGGILDGNSAWTTGAMPGTGGAVGVVAYSGVKASIGYGASSYATGTIIKRFLSAGYEGKAFTHAVGTYVSFVSNEKATYLHKHSSFDERPCEYKKNKLVHWHKKSEMTTDASAPSDYNLGETYAHATDDAGDGNYEIYNFLGGSVEDTVMHATGIMGVDIAHSRDSDTVTGTVGATMAKSLATIYAGHMAISPTGSKYLDVTLTGKSTGATGTKTVDLKFGTVSMGTVTIPAGTQRWKAKYRIWAYSNAQVIAEIESVVSGVEPLLGRLTPLVTMTDEQTVDVYFTVPGASDTCVLEEATVTIWG